MPEDEFPEGNISADDDDKMPLGLGYIELTRLFADVHPILAPVDSLRAQWSFQLRLLWAEWDRAYLVTFLTGVIAFLLGAVSGELFDGGDPKVVGLEGLSSIDGFEFFQIILSGVLWLWFFAQISINFPIMKGHLVNILIIWICAISAQMMYHVMNPQFPLGLKFGEMLGGVVLSAIAIFFTYFFWKAVTETRDLHVQEHHLHTDVRVMERAMTEHSLFAWTTMVVGWVVMLMVNGWSGSHYIADRTAGNTGVLILHLITGPIVIYLLMHILWFPQRMLGEGTKVRTKAAAKADADLLEAGLVIEAEGQCSSCGTPAPVNRNNSGEIIVDCENEDCYSRGKSGAACGDCDSAFPTRINCSSCGLNSPASDYLPDSEAW
ncbi:MAG: hypothetical protein ACKVIR_06600 [Candidatus Poseidoniales archaeon]